MNRLGRKPQGAELVSPLAGSEHAKRRLKLFLKTLAGECSTQQACAELGIGESRFYKQRGDWLQAALETLEPRSAGRPPKQEPPMPPSEVEALRERLRECEARAAAAEAQAELAQVLPRVAQRRELGKKTNFRRR